MAVEAFAVMRCAARTDFSMRSHRRACRKTCEQYDRIWARLPGAPIRCRGPRHGHLFAGLVVAHWTVSHPTCRGVAARPPASAVSVPGPATCEAMLMVLVAYGKPHAAPG